MLVVSALLLAAVVVPVLTQGGEASSNEVDLRVLLIGGVGGGTSDPTTAAWAAGLTNQGVAYTEVDATGTAGAGTESVTLPTLTSSSTHGLYNAVVFADSPAYFPTSQLAPLFSYESTFGIRQIDGYLDPTPAQGLTDVSAGALTETATLTAQGLIDFPSLAGPVPLDSGTYGYPSAVATGLPSGASETPLLTDPSGDVLMGIYQHPSAASDPSDAQPGVAELTIDFDYAATYTQWLLLGPGLINWVTGGAHLGLYRNYVEMDIDDTFTPDDSWDTTNHTIDYSDADALRMQPPDVVYAAQWSQANDFRMDQLFNFGSSVAAQSGDLEYDGSATAPTTYDPLLAAFQATDPNTGEPYSDDFGWISHTYDTPYLDVGCATQNYIEAELNENTTSIAAAPGATAGTGGLGLTVSPDTSLSYGTEDPQVFVPGNHSGFADLVPGNPATVDPPDLDSAASGGTGGTLAPGTYEYAVTDQFNASDSPSVDESAAYVTDPITVSAGQTVTLQWQAICHAANYLIYRSESPYSSWSLVGSYATPTSATLPDNSSGDPTSTADVSGGGELELSYTDTGAAGTAQAAGWTPPVQENANETAWEQNPYFIPALEAVGITAVGDDASKPYPDPPTATFGPVQDPASATYTPGPATYTGPTYAAGQTFVDGTAQVVPRHPINIYYNNSTEAQAVDEYNTIYATAAADPGVGTCVDSSTTTCLTAPATFADIVNQVVSGMFQFMLSNNPEPSYVHQTNLMGSPPGCASATTACNAPPPATVPTTADTTGDGLLYSVLNPLLAEYHSYFNSSTPYVQLTEGAIAATLAEQSAWSAAQPPGTASAANQVVATESGNQITLTNSSTTSSATAPLTVPAGSTVNGAAFGSSYGGTLSGWVTLGAGASTTVLIPSVGQLAPGQTLTANQAITSPNGTYSLIMQGDGNLVEYGPSGALWASGTSSAGDHVTMQSDGNLVVYSSGGSALWASNTSGNAGAYLILGSDGSLRVLSSSGALLWEPGTLLSGDSLANGQSLSLGGYSLNMQGDGNLVEYGPSGALWASGTSSAGDHVTMQSDGNLVVYSSGGSALWASNTSGNAGAYLILGSDGSLRVLSSSGALLWEPGTLLSGDSLANGQSLSLGGYSLNMQGDGNLVEYGPSGALWASGTSSAGDHVTMQSDGNLVVYSSGGSALWASNTSGNAGAYLILGSDGSLRVLSSSGALLWEPGTLLSGDSLANGQSLSLGGYSLNMQGDGNLVEYGPSGALWASGTSSAGDHVTMQSDGNLVVYSSGGSALWASNTSGNAGAYLILGSDGSLRVLSSSGALLWEPGTLLSGDSLANGQSLSLGGYSLNMQGDGNLVEYGPSGALWASGTSSAGDHVTMQSDGNLVVYSSGGSALWASNTSGNAGAYLILGSDGSLRVLSSSGALLASLNA